MLDSREDSRKKEKKERKKEINLPWKKGKMIKRENVGQKRKIQEQWKFF